MRNKPQARNVELDQVFVASSIMGNLGKSA